QDHARLPRPHQARPRSPAGHHRQQHDAPVIHRAAPDTHPRSAPEARPRRASVLNSEPRAQKSRPKVSLPKTLRKKYGGRGYYPPNPTNLPAQDGREPFPALPETFTSSPLTEKFTGPGPSSTSACAAVIRYFAAPSVSSTPSSFTPTRWLGSSPPNWIFPPPLIRTLWKVMSLYCGNRSFPFPG